MDTSEQYIKMCEKAEEIQGNVPEGGVGGSFIGNSILYHIAPTNQAHDMDGYYYIEDEEVVRKCETCGNEEPYIKSTKCIWLPRQDQLQEMIPSPFNNPVALCLAIEEYIIDEMPRIEDYSMEQLWLAFVMKEKYNKIWDGTEWIEQK